MLRGTKLIVGLCLSVVLSTAHATSVTRTTAFTYDATGLVTKTVIEPGDSNLCLATVVAHDAYGNTTGNTIRNCDGSALTIGAEAAAPTGDAVFVSRNGGTTFDARGQFPLTATNALSQSGGTTFEPNYGSLTSSIGPNGLTTTYQYDTLGRKTWEIRADGTRSKWDYLYCAGVNGGTTACPTYAKFVVVVTPMASDGVTANGPWSKSYFDVLGRVIRTQTQGFDGSIIQQDTQYNLLGLVTQSSRPYYSTGTPQWTTYTYDVIGRKLTETTADGSVTTYGYNGAVSTVTNDLGQVYTRTVNSQAQIVSAKDNAGKILTYQYDALGNLVQTTDPLGNTNVMSYDLRGRKTQMVDRDMGTWSYKYNALGELISQTDAKLQTATMTYDKLGRMVKRIEADLVSNWYYDQNKGGGACPKGIGKLCEAESDNGYNRKQTFDSLGRPNQSTNTIDAVYNASVSYDANGRVATQTYPTGLTVKYVYTSLGYLKEVRDNASNALYWSANTLDAEGRLLQQTYGNNVVTYQSYKPTTGRIETILSGAGNAVQNLSYQFDDIGNLLSRSDANQTLNETFLYDNINRLTSATVNASAVSPAVTTTYGYDDIGNITSRSDYGSYAYNPSGASSVRPHAVNAITLGAGGTREYTYDANGNLVQEVQKDASNVVVPAKGRTETYTSYNMPITLNSPAATLSFQYNSEHQRIRQITPTATTIYLNPDNAGSLMYEKDIPTAGAVVHKHYITAGGQVVALIKQSGSPVVTTVQYMHRDMLGSVTAVTNATGAVVERMAYEPFGKRRFPAGPTDPNATIVGVNTDRGFTNHEQLDELGLIHMNGRVYDPMIGRFMTADSVIQDTGALQVYNRYSYTGNNPLVYTDPTGNIFGFGTKAEFARWERDFRHELRRPNSYLGTFIRIAALYATQGSCGAWASACAFGVETTLARAQGMGASDAFRSGLLAGAMADAYRSAGDIGATSGIADTYANSGTLATMTRYVAHAAIGCVGAAAGGGSCGRGAAAAFISAPASESAGRANTAFGLATASVVGGATSSIMGGSFTDGAVTGAFGYIYNWLSYVHRSMTKEAALQAGMSTEQAERLAALVVDVDKQNDDGTLGSILSADAQNVGHSYMHEMCAAGSSASACLNSVTQYLAKSFHMNSMHGLAQVLHAEQDYFSPGHMMREYTGVVGPAHIIGDANPGAMRPYVINNSADLIIRYNNSCAACLYSP